MLLQERGFYSIVSLTPAGERSAEAVIRLNPGCSVYEGHFPGFPIAPGVCSMQTVRECAEAFLGRRLFLGNIIQCRFRQLIEPGKNAEFKIALNFSDIENGTKLVASMQADEIVFLELKAELNYV